MMLWPSVLRCSPSSISHLSTQVPLGPSVLGGRGGEGGGEGDRGEKAGETVGRDEWMTAVIVRIITKVVSMNPGAPILVP